MYHYRRANIMALKDTYVYFLLTGYRYHVPKGTMKYFLQISTDMMSLKGHLNVLLLFWMDPIILGPARDRISVEDDIFKIDKCRQVRYHLCRLI